MPAFFPPSSPLTSAPTPDRPLLNMAAGPDSVAAATQNGMQISRADLEALGNDLKLHFDGLLERKLDQKLDSKLEPITKELKSFKEAIGEVTKTASAAHDMVAALEGRMSASEALEKQLKDRIAWLESRARALNLKIRGLPELQDINSDLVAVLSGWLASFLGVPEESTPTLVAAYRIGPVPTGWQNYSWDVVQFLYAKEREAVLRTARNVSQVYFWDTKVTFLLDLPPDVLLKRRMLKPITDKLKSSNVHFR